MGTNQFQNYPGILMRLATIDHSGFEIPVIVTDTGMYKLEQISTRSDEECASDLLHLIQTGQLKELHHRLRMEEKDVHGESVAPANITAIDPAHARYAPLYRHPGKIWGIGLNYPAHASDLNEKPPASIPASFMKPATTIIGHGDTIRIPQHSHKTTGEAELGIIIGKECRDVPREDWLEVVAGLTCIIDMTAEDILRQNPRYLTLSKSFDTFLSIGPEMITPDEIDDIMAINVSTVINGQVHAHNTVSRMTFPPDHLVSFHSSVMTLLPGDIICTGTPGAVQLHHGDVIACKIDGLTTLWNSVVDLKNSS